jgi:hypothetical protein
MSYDMLLDTDDSFWQVLERAQATNYVIADYKSYQECNSNPQIVQAAMNGVHESFLTDALRFNVKAVLAFNPLWVLQSSLVC